MKRYINHIFGMNKHKKEQELSSEEILQEEKIESESVENQQEKEIEDEDSSALTEEEKLRFQIADLNDKHLRLLSEFDNFRKRNAKERLELVKTASEGVVLSLLTVIDDFERALSAFGENEDIHKEGVELIYNKFMGILERQGVSAMDSNGAEFDPDRMEAIAQIPSQKEELKNKVIETVSKGYEMSGKVIRFAKVVVGA